MNLVFGMDGVISTPCRVYEDVEKSKLITNSKEFIDWLREQGHHITIWCERPNDLAVKLQTEQWLELNQIGLHQGTRGKARLDRSPRPQIH